MTEHKNKPTPQVRIHYKDNKPHQEQSIPQLEDVVNDFEDFGEPRIKVIGVGGGGCNAVKNMADKQIKGVEFFVLNTDAQDLKQIKNENIKKIQIGRKLTKGLGAGTDPKKGEESAEEDIDIIRQCVADSDMIFITSGMGGGTGSGAAKVVAREAKASGALTVGVVTKPFKFEGNKRLSAALTGIEGLKENIDSLITIPNEKLQEALGGEIRLTDAFIEADNILFNAVQGISEIITNTGIVNVDFADVRTVMENGGTTMMGSGQSKGENRALNALDTAINSELLENIELKNASGILVNITTNNDLQMSEYEEIGAFINSLAREDATIVIGTINDYELEEGDLKINIVASGLDAALEGNEKGFLSTARNTASGVIKQSNVSTDHNRPQSASKNVNTDNLPNFLKKRSE